MQTLNELPDKDSAEAALAAHGFYPGTPGYAEALSAFYAEQAGFARSLMGGLADHWHEYLDSLPLTSVNNN